MTHEIQVWIQSMKYGNLDNIISFQIGLIWASGEPIYFYDILCDKARMLQDTL